MVPPSPQAHGSGCPNATALGTVPPPAPPQPPTHLNRVLLEKPRHQPRRPPSTRHGAPPHSGHDHRRFRSLSAAATGAGAEPGPRKCLRLPDQPMELSTPGHPPRISRARSSVPRLSPDCVPSPAVSPGHPSLSLPGSGVLGRDWGGVGGSERRPPPGVPRSLRLLLRVRSSSGLQLGPGPLGPLGDARACSALW